MVVYRQPGAYSEVIVSPVLAVAPGGIRVAYLIGKGVTVYSKTQETTRGSTAIDDLDPTGTEITKVYPTAIYPEYASSLYALSSGDIEWLDPTGSDAPEEDDVYYVDYNYNKVTADYTPRLFYSMQDVIAEHGVVETGNTLSIAAQLAFENGASVVGTVQVQETGNDYNDFNVALAKLELVSANVIVPLYASSTFATAVLKSHIARMSAKPERKERVGLVGLDETSAAIAAADWQSLASGLGSKRIGLVYPGKISKVLEAGEVNLDGTFLCAAIAGAMTAADFDSAEPITNRDLAGISDVEINILNTAKNALATSGIMIVDERGGTPYIRHGLTTDMTTITGQEITITTSIDDVVGRLRTTLENVYTGVKFLNTTASSIAMTVQTNLLSFIEDELITAYRDLSVTRNAIDPRQADIVVKVMPIFAVNWLEISITLVASI